MDHTGQQTRFSGMLRSLLGENAHPPTSEAVRDEELKRRTHRTTLTFSNEKSGSSAGTNRMKNSQGTSTLNLSYFSQYLPSHVKTTESQQIEKMFRSFIRLTQKLLEDDGIPSEVLHNSAYIFYKICHNQDKTVAEKELEMKKYARNITKSDLETAIETATKLSEWKKGKIAESDRKATNSSSSTSSSPSTNDIFGNSTFGLGIEFNFGRTEFSDDESTLAEELSTGLWDDLDIDNDIDDSFRETIPNSAGSNSLSQQGLNVITAEYKGTVDITWLRNECEKFLKSGTGAAWTTNELVDNLLNIIKTKQESQADFQAKLIDILGFEGLDFALIIFTNRPKLLQYLASEESKLGGGRDSGIQAQGSLTIINKTEQERSKKHEKEKKRLHTLAKEAQEQVDTAKSQLSLLPSSTHIEANETAFDKSSRKRIKQMLDNQKPEILEKATKKEPELVQMANLSGAIRRDGPISESHYIAAKFPSPGGYAEELKPIKEYFEPWAQMAFSGMKTLNRIQSKVYECAYKSNNNMLICAPTGAGKTNIALMTILHEIGEHMGSGNVIRLDDFKIVYVAPMKALAAEMTENFARRLLPLNVTVKELTGDMQLTKKEIQETQIIVTTPEKWDVITRKSNDNSLALQVKLLIIDEVHLLQEDRGSVIESLVARTLRQVEQTQAMIRIVGLSATLPNYRDVANFLHVDFDNGLFYFDASYRPVPLSQEFIGIKQSEDGDLRENMNYVCCDKMIKSLKEGNQVMIFVHSRKDTVLTGKRMLDLLIDRKKSQLTRASEQGDSHSYSKFAQEFEKSRNRELAYLFPHGFGFHNAGMLRSDRNLVERAFTAGFIRVLVCTATLAWGVNLPAHTVIIKGTQIYAPEKGGFIDLGVLDVNQIFGRAGRPQFDTSGEAILLTNIDRLSHFLRVMSVSVPIESTFETRLSDHLNAEIVLGTVTNVKEAIQWLSYTYFWIRLQKNPLAYGINQKQIQKDPSMTTQHLKIIKKAAMKLDECKMIRYDEKSGQFHSTELGRVASHFYIQYETIQLFNDFFDNAMKKKPAVTNLQTLGERQNMRVQVVTEEQLQELEMTIDPRYIYLDDHELLYLASQASEFANIKLRDEEMDELEILEQDSRWKVKEGDTNERKVNILIQSYISQAKIESFSLASDMVFISQNTGRIFRALFEITMKKNWPRIALKLLQFCHMVEHRLWDRSSPLRQFDLLSPELIWKLEEKRMDVDRLLDMTADEVASSLRTNVTIARRVLSVARSFPRLSVTATVQPVTRTVIKIHLTLSADFSWNDKIHGTVEPWWIWIEDMDQSFVYHSEYFLLHRKQKNELQHMTLIVPIEDPPPSQYRIHVFSDRWFGAETVEILPFDNLILPHEYPPHTDLLPLQPLMLQCLENRSFEALYNFTHFNPVQTQVFHTLYHTNSNVLLGAPTGSGKTIVAELAMLKLFRDSPLLKVVYIAPLKALVRERIKDWEKRFVGKLGKKMVELTGDYTPDIQSLMTADIVTTTPEKWDGISRNWQQRDYVQRVGLVIIDEIHLLAEDRGPILEVIVSRMRYISSVVDVPVRIVGLSTALANATDLADWLGIDRFAGLFNFRPSVRPVPLEVHITGFRGKHYCPRMATMNKPAFNAIKTYSPDKPTLIFVSSRRQTRLTAIDLISCCASDDEQTTFLNMGAQELAASLEKVKDSSLRHTLSFGIGLHHAGLPDEDKSLVEELFGENKIQVLVSTATLAWGVNLPAHLVIIKGTEFYDAPSKRYVDYPITDVLQMMGRAGRPQFDNEGCACVFVEESRKSFYTKFLYEPFPVESQLKSTLHDHINAEVVSGTIKSKQDAVDYLTWTFFFRRLMKNPSYYQLDSTEPAALNKYLSDLVDSIMSDLKAAHCIILHEELNLDSGVSLQSSSSSILSSTSVIGNARIEPHTYGKVASFYYLHYTTMKVFLQKVTKSSTIRSLLETMCATHEYSELPVRHNEDGLNADLSKHLQWPPNSPMDSPHTKANILLQAHLSDLALPISDYITDTKQVLDQTVRVAQAIVDVAADGGWLQTALNAISLLQMCIQGRWCTESTLTFLPGCSNAHVRAHLSQNGIDVLPQLLALKPDQISSILHSKISQRSLKQLITVTRSMPVYNVSRKVVKMSLDDDGQIQCTLNVQLTRLSDEPVPKVGIFAPRFPKYKDEGWWLIVGSESSDELLALRKLNSSRKKMSANLTFKLADNQPPLSLYFMSDCYIGLDQQLQLPIEM